MAKMDSVSKMVSRGVKSSAKVATESVSSVAKTTTKGTSKVIKKVQGLCNANSIIPCLTAITLIAYIVIVTPSTVLDLFSTKLGKSLSMALVLVALLFDLKLGVMLGLAVVLSISLASVNKDLYESFEDEVFLPEEDEFVDKDKFKQLKQDFKDHKHKHTHEDVADHMHSRGPAKVVSAEPFMGHMEDVDSSGEEEFASTVDDVDGSGNGVEGFTTSGEVTGLDDTMCKYAPFVQES